MKKKTKVLFTLVFAITLIFALLVPTFAAYDDNGYVIWEIKDGGNVLVGEKEYYRIEIPAGYKVSSHHSKYYFANSVKDEKFELTNMYTNVDGHNIVYAYEKNSMDGVYFADKETYNYLWNFFDFSRAKNRANIILFCSDYEYYKDGNNRVLEMLDSMTGTALDVEVATLENYNKTHIYAYDTTGWIRTTVGCVYALGDTRYYVDYTTLPNIYFDSYGDFSYRDGTISAMLLDSKTDAAFQGLKSSDNQYDFGREEQYEKDVFDMIFPDFNEDVVVIFGIVIFYSILILVGLVLPVIPIVLGLVLPRSKKLGKHPGWYALAGVGAIWLISAVVLIIYITVCFLLAVLGS